MTCPSLLYSAFAAFVTNREDCKLEAAHRVRDAFDVVDSKRRKFQEVTRPIPSPPVHVPLPADQGELAHSALNIVFQLHAGRLCSFADDEWTRLQRASELIQEWRKDSEPVRIGHMIEDYPVDWRRETGTSVWRRNNFLANLRDSMVTRIRKLSPTFIPAGALSGGPARNQGFMMIYTHVQMLHHRHEVARRDARVKTSVRAADPY